MIYKDRTVYQLTMLPSTIFGCRNEQKIFDTFTLLRGYEFIERCEISKEKTYATESLTSMIGSMSICSLAFTYCHEQVSQVSICRGLKVWELSRRCFSSPFVTTMDSISENNKVKFSIFVFINNASEIDLIRYATFGYFIVYPHSKSNLGFANCIPRKK